MLWRWLGAGGASHIDHKVANLSVPVAVAVLVVVAAAVVILGNHPHIDKCVFSLVKGPLKHIKRKGLKKRLLVFIFNDFARFFHKKKYA